MIDGGLANCASRLIVQFPQQTNLPARSITQIRSVFSFMLGYLVEETCHID
jgi:hypothetical protein